MRVHLSILFTGMAFVVVPLSAQAQATRFPHWQMIQEVVQQLESRPPRPTSISGSLQTPGQEYPFEAFRHLRVVDLMRAAREGIMQARQQAVFGTDPQRIDRQALHNVMIALEYLPTILRDTPEFENVVKALENREEDPVLRHYVLSQFDIDRPSRTLLGMTFEDYVPLTPDYCKKVFTSLASHPAERPDIQAEAIRIYYARLCREYEFASSTPEVPQVSPAESASLALADVSALLDAVPGTGGKDIAREIQSFAGHIAGHIAEHSVRDERVKKETRRVLLHMQDHIALPNPANMAFYLEGRAPREESTFPPLPVPFPAQNADEELPPEGLDPSDPFSWPAASP